MWPNCKEVQSFKCSETKARYLTTFGISPYLERLIRNKTAASSDYVLLFDESLNSELQKKQLDVHVRLWDDELNAVSSRYLGSQLMGHATAKDFTEAIDNITEGISYSKLVQISMDGPSVNWKFYDEFQSRLAIHLFGEYR